MAIMRRYRIELPSVEAVNLAPAYARGWPPEPIVGPVPARADAELGDISIWRCDPYARPALSHTSIIAGEELDTRAPSRSGHCRRTCVVAPLVSVARGQRYLLGGRAGYLGNKPQYGGRALGPCQLSLGPKPLELKLLASERDNERWWHVANESKNRFAVLVDYASGSVLGRVASSDHDES